MTLTPKKLHELITQGESDTVEFKKGLPPDESVSTILTAFANTKGGILILGVEDKGGVIGLTESEIVLAAARIHRIASSLFSWPFEIGSIELAGKQVVYIFVSQAPDYLIPITTSTGRVYVRKGAQVVALSKSKLPSTRKVIINDRKVEIDLTP